MSKLAKLSSIIIIMATLIIGCSNSPMPVAPENDEPFGLALFTLPEGATFESATLHIYVAIPSVQTVNIHRATDDWGEMTVTWNNFDEAFDAAVSGSFEANTNDWSTVNVTSLVGGWLNGAYANHGLLLDQEITPYPRAIYHSREASINQPYLEIGYVVDSETVYQQVACDADAYINEIEPDNNFGSETVLFSGFAADTDYEKQSLLYFDIEGETQTEGCTNTIGYWKNHTGGCRPQSDEVSQFLPITLGNADGDKSVNVTNTRRARRILRQRFGRPFNGITKLYAQLLAAKLNIANGADDSDVAETITAADNFLSDHGRRSWYRLSSDDRNMILGWKDMLDDYNNGEIGPGHCDD
ncbi:MAG: DNRLRE domain-containing protein [candidate division Zixibacteria bacterium]|nr:DNRLRE domain-containing protein [candidate division Zixibacteria bacterium]